MEVCHSRASVGPATPSGLGRNQSAGQGHQTCPAKGKGSPRTLASNRFNRDGGYKLPGCWIVTMKKLGGGGNRTSADSADAPPIICTRSHGRASTVATPIRAYDELDAVLGTRAASSPPIVLESSGTGSSTDQDTGMVPPSPMSVPYSRKIWRGIKFGGLAVYITTAKLKSAKISYSHIYVWRSRTEPPNLNLPIFF